MDFLIFIVICILSFPISVVNFLLTGRIEYFKYRGVLASMTLNRYYSNFFNRTLRVEGGYEFGKENETTSCALGKNQILGTLSSKGAMVVRFLEKCETHHCLKSVHEEEYEERKREIMSKK